MNIQGTFLLLGITATTGVGLGTVAVNSGAISSDDVSGLLAGTTSAASGTVGGETSPVTISAASPTADTQGVQLVAEDTTRKPRSSGTRKTASGSSSNTGGSSAGSSGGHSSGSSNGSSSGNHHGTSSGSTSGSGGSGSGSSGGDDDGYEGHDEHEGNDEGDDD